MLKTVYSDRTFLALTESFSQIFCSFAGEAAHEKRKVTQTLDKDRIKLDLIIRFRCFNQVHTVTRRVVGVFVRFRAPLRIPLQKRIPMFQLGDILHLVGNPEGLKKMHLIIGEEVDIPVASLSGEIRSERVVVTNEKYSENKFVILVFIKIWCSHFAFKPCRCGIGANCPYYPSIR